MSVFEQFNFQGFLHFSTALVMATIVNQKTKLSLKPFKTQTPNDIPSGGEKSETKQQDGVNILFCFFFKCHCDT